MKISNKLIILILFSILSVSSHAKDTIKTSKWYVKCLDDGVCELTTTISSNKHVAARLSVFNLRGHFLFQYVLPSGVDFTQGVSLVIDDQLPIATNILNCGRFGCLGTANLTSELVQLMKKGKQMQIVFYSPNNQDKFVINFSLSGFTAGFNKMVSK